MSYAPRLRLATDVVAVGLAGTFAITWLLGAIVHVDDGRSVDHVAGTWMALAAATNAGTFYPPLYDGEFFGGTRFAPLPIALQALAAQVSGEYLVSAKVLGYVLAVVLLAVVFVVVRRSGCGTPLALLLTSTLLVTGTGVTATTGIRNDVLPLVLQLAALLLVLRGGRRALLAAGVLCALAIASKLSALWAPVAILAWLATRDRRSAGVFVATLAGVLAAVAGAAELASGGRMSDNLVLLALPSTSRVVEWSQQVDRLRATFSLGLGLVGALVLLAVVATASVAVRKRLTLVHLAFVASLAVTGVVLLDPGAFLNHLLDMQVLALPVVGALAAGATSSQGKGVAGRLALVAVVVVAAVGEYAEHASPLGDIRLLAEGRTAAEDRVPPLADALDPTDRILSEDPSVPVLRGARPVVLDPYMLIAVGDAHPAWRDALVGRIARAEFDKIVLLGLPSEIPDWYRGRHLGAEVAAAVESRYRPIARADGYWVFVPT